MLPPRSPKSGSLTSQCFCLRLSSNLEKIPNSEPTLPEVQYCSSTQIFTVYTQPVSSTLKICHSPTPPLSNLQITIDNYTIPSKKKDKYPFFLKSGVLHPTLHPFRNSSQTNKMIDEHPTHQILKANLLFVYRTHTVYYAY